MNRFDQLKDFIKSQEFNMALSMVATGISISHPVYSAFISVFQGVTSVVDEFKIECVLRGMATGINQEKQINQMYNYVSKNEDNAFYIANTLRKALLSDSPIVCTILGRILADHISTETPYDREDKIIVHALESATDDDIRLFMKIMREDILKVGSKEEYENFYNILQDNPELQDSIDWCVSNRIFKENDVNDFGDTLSFEKSYSLTQVAFRLRKYAESVWQVFHYGLDK